jgi:hypothetical protein
MNLEEYSKEKIWSMLIEAVHANVMYPTHKSYTREVILHENPDISAGELADKLNMPTGEAIVILDELLSENKPSSA